MSGSVMDLTSSPDPLNASLEDSMTSSARRVTRSHVSQKFFSLGTSPRKQKFTLDVGNQISPQKILVTVEAGEQEAMQKNVNRKLFQSPTPQRGARRREKITTTTVPLKGLTDDEGDGNTAISTPRRRGRPPKAGTPAAGKRGRPPTPRKGTPRRAVTQSEGEDDQPTPRPRSQTPKRALKRKSDTPARGDSSTTSLPKKRGRPRKYPASDETAAFSGSDRSENASMESDNAPPIREEENIFVAGSSTPTPSDNEDEENGYDDHHNNANGAETEEDIWMATLSDGPLPPARSPSPDYGPTASDKSSEPEPVQPQSEASQMVRSEIPQSEMSVDWAAAGDAAEMASTALDEERRDSGGKDTVMLGEEFTMISIGSLQTLQASSSMNHAPEDQQDVGEETSLIINRTLESLRQSRGGNNQEGAQRALETTGLPVGTERALPASETRRNTSANVDTIGDNNNINNSHLGTSMFSQHSPLRSARSPRRANPPPLGKQLAMKSIRREDDPGQPRAMSAEINSSAGNLDESVPYDDSFSEIPDDVLEAVTPKPLGHAVVEQSSTSAVENSAEAEADQPSTTESDPQPAPRKMLTPDETPSPAELGENEKEASPRDASGSPVESEMHSSPPVLTFTREGSAESVVHRPRRGSSETPAVREPSSPRLPPPVEGVGAQGKNLAPPESIHRPTLSPIVRAGRALQLVTSDPPSPPERGSTLGSPFRSSTGAPSQSPTAPPLPAARPNPSPGPGQAPALTRPSSQQSNSNRNNRSWSQPFAPLNQFKSLVVKGAQALSPRRASQPAMEDPFSGPRRGSQDHTGRSLSVSHDADSHVESNQIDPGVSMTSSTGANLPTEDGMSWQGDVSPIRALMGPTSGSPSSTVRGRRGSIDPDIEMSLVDDPDEPIVRGQEGQEDQDEMRDDGMQDDDEQEDIWAVEAQRPTPGRPQARHTERPVFDPPHRGMLPTPWRHDNNRRSVANGPVVPQPPRMNSTNSLRNEDPEELSMLSQQSRNDASPKPLKAAADGDGPLNVPKPRKVDLSNFFSSPALAPGLHAPGPKPFPSGDHPQREPTQTQPQPPLFQAQPQRQMTLPLASPKKAATQLPSQGSRPRALTPQKGFQVGGPRRVDLFSPVKQRSIEDGPGLDESTRDHSSSPATPEQRPLFAHVPQKRNFTPRPRQPGNALFFSRGGGGGSSTDHSNGALAKAAQVLDEDESDADGYDSSPDSSGFVQPPELKPLPDRSMSPTKSCIRSPLKPKTPGRVVEFASSALSPLQQAEARARSRSSTSPEKQQQRQQQWFQQQPQNTAQNSFSASMSFASRNTETDKENQPSDSSNEELFASSSSPSCGGHSGAGLTVSKKRVAAPIPAPSIPVPRRRLSQNQWTRDHWTRLDELLQERRRNGALRFQLRHGPPSSSSSSAQKNRPGGGVALLGKLIAAQGETMALEQWHLDVVGAFRAEVGGWDESVLAKRLFALMVGEERRRRGEVPSRRGMR